MSEKSQSQRQGFVASQLPLFIDTSHHRYDTMASFLRGLLPIGQASSSRRVLTSLPIRYSSTSAPAPAPAPAPSTTQRDLLNPPSSTSSGSASRYTQPQPLGQGTFSPELTGALSPPNSRSPDAWWSTNTSSSLARLPGDQYTGRSIRLKGGKGFQQAYRQLMGVLSRTGVRKDVRDGEFFEKPHVRRNREKSERHRRRFQEMVSASLIP